MTLKEMQKKVLALIEEVSTDETKLTDDPDIEAKLNDVINQISNELARIKRIPVRESLIITSNMLEFDMKDLDNFYILDSLFFTDDDGEEQEAEIFGTFVTFPCAGLAKFNYYKLPDEIKSTTSGSYTFELDDDALSIMPYGVAGDLLKSDVSNSYGTIYSNRYEQMKQMLDSRNSYGHIYIEGGI